jgi:hypothetical protein
MAVNHKLVKFKPKQSPVSGKTVPAVSGFRNSGVALPGEPGGMDTVPPPARELPSAMPISLPLPHSGQDGDIGLPLSGEGISASPLPGQKIHRLQSTIQKEKTGVIRDSSLEEPEPPEQSPDKAIQSRVEEFRDQLQSYLEVCDSIGHDQWSPQDVIDVLHMLIRSLNLDVVSMVLTDPEQPGQLGAPVVSRGYRTPPGSGVRECWQQAVNSDGRGINWQTLMGISADSGNALSKWLARESLHSYGYVPIRDNHVVHGFLLIGAHEKKDPSPLASALLELTGGRIGLSLAARHTGGDWPDTVLSSVCEIRDQFTLIMGCFEMLRENVKGVCPADSRELLDQCGVALTESIRLLDHLTAAAARSRKG